MPLLDLHGGDPADRHAGRHIPHRPALGGDAGGGGDGEMIGDADLATHHDAVADHRAAGDADLTADDAAAAEAHVVADMDEVIEHRAGTDHRIAGGAAVDRAIGAHLDIVLDDDAAELQHAHEPFGAGHEAEALPADADAGGDLDARADERIADSGVRLDPAAVAEHHAITERDMRSDVAAGADHDVAADMSAGLDLRSGADRGGGMDIGARGDAGNEGGGRGEKMADLGISETRARPDEEAGSGRRRQNAVAAGDE